MPKLAAYGVHLFTASGIVFGFLALLATLQDQPFAAFMYLGIALVIDGVDGTLARAAHVKRYTPHIDGGSLDYVIDYVTYALVPAVMIWQWALVPAGLQSLAAIAVLLAASYTFANANMKTADGYFVGFPAIWNLVVFILVILDVGPWVSLIALGLCWALSFVPSPYVHPFRSRLFRPLTLGMTLIWLTAASLLSYGVLGNGVSATEAPVSLALLILSSLYFAALSGWRSLRGPMGSSRTP